MNSSLISTLPIDDVLPDILAALESHRALILHAPPGAGKTTKVPLALLLSAGWLQGQRILMLEPRRLAARAAAYRMADLLSEAVGARVGYRTRLDTQVSAKTRIEVVTEGVLTRMLQHDPELSGIGCVIFDEFHERSLQADLGLALCLDVQKALRDDLRLLVMSATLDTEKIASLLCEAAVVSSQGRSFPVDVRYVGSVSRPQVVAQTVAVIERALNEEAGSVLVFLPGEAEIRKACDALAGKSLGAEVAVLPLYGALSRDEQDRAIRPCREGQRKVVLATAIAETSLTIDGVRVVIDAGLARLARFDSNAGMGRLETVRVSQAAAAQRCGRAGRVEPGVCYRLWSADQHKGLVKFHDPEILAADLVPLALELAQWGIADPSALAWIDPPPAQPFNQAQALLRDLGALTEAGRMTPHGRELLQLGIHPRLAHMVLKAGDANATALACDIVALLEERDLFDRNNAVAGVNLEHRLAALHGDAAYVARSDRGVLQRVRQAAQQLRRRCAKETKSAYIAGLSGRLLALAYPDRIAQTRASQDGRLLLSNGKGAQLDELDALAKSDYLVVAKLGGMGAEARVQVAAAIDKETVREVCRESLVTQVTCLWDEQTQSVQVRREERLGALLLNSQRLEKPDRAHVQQALLAMIRRKGLGALPLGEAQWQWLARVRLAKYGVEDGGWRCAVATPWPDVSESALLASMETWLTPYLAEVKNAQDLQRLDMSTILRGLLTWEQQQWLDEHVPACFVAPTGSRIDIDYLPEDGPTLSIKLQELFGLAQTPSIAQGRVKLKLHLLSPARRPIQITQDLPGFWTGSYSEVKKEMKGRYPKHYWPDDPLQAQPTKYAKPRS